MLCIDPKRQGWQVANALRKHPVAEYLGGASITLASWTPRPLVRRALDLGVGAGVQALHLAAHAEQVVEADAPPGEQRLEPKAWVGASREASRQPQHPPHVAARLLGLQ